MQEQKEKMQISPGTRVGHLKVKADTGRRKNRYIIWRCECDCGNSLDLDTRTLRRGTVTDCGCITKVRPGQRDLTGLRFGKLLCLEPTKGRKYGTTVWKCLCDCGRTAEVPARQLTAGYVKSCGCLGHPALKNLKGMRFGSLTVIAYDGKRDGMHRWLCRCDCGNETVVGQTLLLSGKTKSCGCLQKRIILKNLNLVDGTSVTILESGKNRRISSNTSGYTGVYFQKCSGRWAAQITFRGKTHFLGSYIKKEDAIKARQKGEEEFFDKFLNQYYAVGSRPPDNPQQIEWRNAK